MSYFKLTDKPHGKPRKKKWCVEWKEGGKKRRKLFKTEAEAREFDEDNNSRIRRTGLGLLGVRELRKYTAREIIRSYMHSNRLTADDDLFEDKEKLEEATDLPNNVFLHLWGLSRRKEFELSLFDFNEQVAEQYKDTRLIETYTTHNTNSEKQLSPRTVRWEISHLQKAWKWARKIPDLSHLNNPWEGLRIKGSTGGRQKRGLRPGELQRLLDKCKGCLGVNRYYVPLAISIAIDTGMRRQEILNLTWEDVDFKNRRITIRKSKTDWTALDKGKEPGRVIVLPFTSDNLLGHLSLSLQLYGRLPGTDMVVTEPGSPATGRIFPMTGDAFYQAFRDVRRNAKLEHITFRSTLRTTAKKGFALGQPLFFGLGLSKSSK